MPRKQPVSDHAKRKMLDRIKSGRWRASEGAYAYGIKRGTVWLWCQEAGLDTSGKARKRYILKDALSDD